MFSNNNLGTEKECNDNYKNISKFPHELFPNRGQRSIYEIQTGIFSVTSTDIAKLAIQKINSREILGVDLGTGSGSVPAEINSQFQHKINMLGITAKTDEVCSNPVIYGNIEKLSAIPELKNKKIDFFISVHTLCYVSSPLKVLQDAYAMLEKGGFIFFDHFLIRGITYMNGMQLLHFLRQKGYEVIAGKNPEYDRVGAWNTWGPVWLFIRKNHLETLELPVTFDKDTQVDMEWGDTNTNLQITYSYFKANQELTQFSSLDFDSLDKDNKASINETFKVWGLESILMPEPTKEIFAQLKESIAEKINSYLFSCAIRFFKGEHFQRALNIKNAILKENNLGTIKAIIANQTSLFDIKSDGDNTVVISENILAKRWTTPDNLENKNIPSVQNNYVNLMKAISLEIEKLTAIRKSKTLSP